MGVPMPIISGPCATVHATSRGGDNFPSGSILRLGRASVGARCGRVPSLPHFGHGSDALSVCVKRRLSNTLRPLPSLPNNALGQNDHGSFLGTANTLMNTA